MKGKPPAAGIRTPRGKIVDRRKLARRRGKWKGLDGLRSPFEGIYPNCNCGAEIAWSAVSSAKGTAERRGRSFVQDSLRTRKKLVDWGRGDEEEEGPGVWNNQYGGEKKTSDGGAGSSDAAMKIVGGRFSIFLSPIVVMSAEFFCTLHNPRVVEYFTLVFDFSCLHIYLLRFGGHFARNRGKKNLWTHAENIYAFRLSGENSK